MNTILKSKTKRKLKFSIRDKIKTKINVMTKITLPETNTLIARRVKQMTKHGVSIVMLFNHACKTWKNVRTLFLVCKIFHCFKFKILQCFKFSVTTVVMLIDIFAFINVIFTCFSFSIFRLVILYLSTIMTLFWHSTAVS